MPTIKELKVHIVTGEIKSPFFGAQGWVRARSSLIVEIITSCEDVIGIGECLCHGYQPPQLAASFIENCYRSAVIGKSIFDVEVIWETLYNMSRTFGQYGIAINAISGIDMAIWDAIGKYLNQPVCNLIGGCFRDRVKAYATGFYRIEGAVYPDDAVKEAVGYVNKGFTGKKVKIGMGVQKDIEHIRAIREAVGPDIMLGADANCAYNVSTAVQLIDGLKDYNLYFLEEPLAPEDMRGYMQLRFMTPTMITAGENMFGKIALREWISNGALDIYQPDLGHAGGFTELKKIAALTQAYQTLLMPHVWGSGVLLAATLQFLATLPPVPMTSFPWEPMIEFDQSEHPFRFELINNGIEFKDGHLIVPKKPGIGVEINRDVLKKFKIN